MEITHVKYLESWALTANVHVWFLFSLLMSQRRRAWRFTLKEGVEAASGGFLEIRSLWRVSRNKKSIHLVLPSRLAYHLLA
jgi:hypothetical protein